MVAGNRETNKPESTETFSFAPNVFVVMKVAIGTKMPHSMGISNMCVQKTSTLNIRANIMLEAA